MILSLAVNVPVDVAVPAYKILDADDCNASKQRLSILSIPQAVSAFAQASVIEK